MSIYVKISLCLLVAGTGYTNHRTKRWIWDDILGLGSSTTEVKDVGCGTHPTSPDLKYRFSTPFQQLQLPYPSAFACTWKFYGEGCNPVVSCNPFQLADSAQCTGAHLEITDELTVSKKFCGSTGPINATTASNILVAKFPRSISIPSRGFSCLVVCANTTNNNTEGLNVITDPLPAPSNIVNCTCGNPGAISANQRLQQHRVVGGKNAPPLYWKWQVALVPKGRTSPFCGGSLINDRFVLSAAHCVVTTGLVAIPPAADVVLNAYNIKNSSEAIIRRSVVGIYPHPFYDTIGQDYDYSVIEFAPPVDLTSTSEPYARPVCLPPRYTTSRYVGETATVTGWGVTTEGGEQARILQEADIPVITNSDCAEQYGNGSSRIKITDRMLCAAHPEGGTDSCQGDSGGPFVLNNGSNRYTQIGVVSFGEGCARKGKPGVYARTTEVSDWIRSVAKYGNWCRE